jgi:hypothetical protein
MGVTMSGKVEQSGGLLNGFIRKASEKIEQGKAVAEKVIENGLTSGSNIKDKFERTLTVNKEYGQGVDKSREASPRGAGDQDSAVASSSALPGFPRILGAPCPTR